MLEKVRPDLGVKTLSFRDIMPNEIGQGVCLVRDGRHKMSRVSKPFITLYLQDINGAVIPGYVFDLENFMYSGSELNLVIGSLVQVSYEENYIPNYGMSLRLTKVLMVKQPSAQLIQAFVGSVDDIDGKYDYLQDAISKRINTRYAIPFSVRTLSHLDYSQGKAGGLLYHYYQMCKVLESYEDIFGKENSLQLFGTFLLYIHAHNNFIQAEKLNAVDINLSNRLTASIAKVMEKVRLGEGAAEVCNVFFGFEPKDIFVRTVCQVSESILRVAKEKNTWDSLPLAREGDAGYGTIRRYREYQPAT